MECHKAARRLKRIMRSAERLDVSPQDLARLPGFKKLLAQRTCERSRILQTFLPVICTVVVFLLYCYCNHHENNGSQQSLAGHYDDMVSRKICIKFEIGQMNYSCHQSHDKHSARQIACRPMSTVYFTVCPLCYSACINRNCYKNTSHGFVLPYYVLNLIIQMF